jgi:hypothetical protein
MRRPVCTIGVALPATGSDILAADPVRMSGEKSRGPQGLSNAALPKEA